CFRGTSVSIVVGEKLMLMTFRRFIRLSLWTIASCVILVAVVAALVWWYFHPSVQRRNGVVYGQRGEGKLVLDVIKPRAPNGLGVLVMVSGGWRSGRPGSFEEWMASPLLRHGYTVFAIYHVSQPEATVMEII